MNFTCYTKRLLKDDLDTGRRTIQSDSANCIFHSDLWARITCPNSLSKVALATSSYFSLLFPRKYEQIMCQSAFCYSNLAEIINLKRKKGLLQLSCGSFGLWLVVDLLLLGLWQSKTAHSSNGDQEVKKKEKGSGSHNPLWGYVLSELTPFHQALPLKGFTTSEKHQVED